MKNNMRYLLILLFISLSYHFCMAQDTLRLMHYNLLYYGNSWTYCTNSNNNTDNKARELAKIIKLVQPDIITVNEMSDNTVYHQHLLDSALNIDGVDYYAVTGFANTSNSNIINLLYYDTRKFNLQHSEGIYSSTRDIDIHRLYYNDPDLSYTMDTAFLTCIIAHLKAGTGSSDKDQRAQMTSGLMTYLDNINAPGNYIFSGDFNMKSSSEQAWYNLTNYPNSSIIFYDPADMVGSWYNNTTFRYVHSQSTRINSGGCGAGGGLDDRFDFIMASGNIMNGTDHWEYISGSYKVVGQDGIRLNYSINDPTNLLVTSEIADALYTVSDHLPIIVDLVTDQMGAGIPEQAISIDARIINANHDYLRVGKNLIDELEFRLFNISGQLLKQGRLDSQTTTIGIGDLPAGLYILQLSSETHFPLSLKFIKP